MIYDISELLSEITKKCAEKEDRNDSLEAILAQMQFSNFIYKKYGLVTALNAVLNREI